MSGVHIWKITQDYTGAICKCPPCVKQSKQVTISSVEDKVPALSEKLHSTIEIFLEGCNTGSSLPQTFNSIL